MAHRLLYGRWWSPCSAPFGHCRFSRRYFSTTLMRILDEGEGRGRGLDLSSRARLRTFLDRPEDPNRLRELAWHVRPRELSADLCEELTELDEGTLSTAVTALGKEEEKGEDEDVVQVVKWLEEVGWRWRTRKALEVVVRKLSKVRGGSGAVVKYFEEWKEIVKKEKVEEDVEEVYADVVASLGLDGLLELAEEVWKDYRQRMGRCESWVLRREMILARVRNDDGENALTDIRHTVEVDGWQVPGEIFSELIASQGYDPASALKSFASMVELGIEPDIDANAAIIRAHGLIGNVDPVRELIAGLSRTDSVGRAAAIDALRRCGEESYARKIFLELDHPSIEAYCAMMELETFAGGNLSAAWRLKIKAEGEGLRMDRDVYRIFLRETIRAENMLGFTALADEMKLHGVSWTKDLYAEMLEEFVRHPYASFELAQLRDAGKLLPVEYISLLNAMLPLAPKVKESEEERDPLVPLPQKSDRNRREFSFRNAAATFADTTFVNYKTHQVRRKNAVRPGEQVIWRGT